MANRKKKVEQKKAKSKVLLTVEGLAKVQAELDQLLNSKRPHVVARIQRARELGDLSENTEYDAARDEQSFVEGRIQELTNIVRHAQVIDDRASRNDFILIGSTVVVEANGERDEFTIVGSFEADPLQGRISNESPVGKGLLGAKAGESVEIATSVVKTLYKVISIK